MWLIAGTSPQLAEGQLVQGVYTLEGAHVVDSKGNVLRVERGLETLATAATLVCAHLGKEAPHILCAGDRGKGHGSGALYAHFAENLATWHVQGVTFHYLFPDVDGHNRVLMAVDAYEQITGNARPMLVADAGFMYVAKMSGYADSYDLFTPDVGEMAFLADELAPHPFYTRGFLLDKPDSIEELLERAHAHGNVAKNLIIKGHTDYIVAGKEILHTVQAPSVDTMEAIGGTGDLVTGLVTGLLASGFVLHEACLVAARTNRVLADLVQPTPATQVSELTPRLCEALDKVMQSI